MQSAEEMIDDNAAQEEYQQVLRRKDYRHMTTWDIARCAAIELGYPDGGGKNVPDSVMHAAARTYLLAYLEMRNDYLKKSDELRDVMNRHARANQTT